MLFNSLAFFAFFAVVLTVYRRIGSNEGRKRFLVFGSYVFYAGWDYRFCLLLAGVTAVAYFGALAIAQRENHSARRTILSVSVASLLGVLGIFKYTNFFLDSFALSRLS